MCRYFQMVGWLSAVCMCLQTPMRYLWGSWPWCSELPETDVYTTHLENPKNLLKDRQIQEQGGRQQPMCSLLRKIRGQRKKIAHTYWDLETFILKLCVAELYIRGSNWVGEEDLRLDSYVSISKTWRSGYQVFSKVLKSSFNVRISCVNFQQIHKKMWLSSRTKLRQ